MSWIDFHAKSESLAGEAEVALRQGETERARNLYRQAADAETKALDEIDKSKKRTLGVSIVSAVALWYKAGEYELAQQVAYKWLSTGNLPEFADEEIKNLLQSIWNETVRQRAGVKFAPGQVVVSVKGGEIVTGGAPLDLIVEKVKTIQSLFFRTAELLNGMPHRSRGAPSSEICEMFRPWLFQTIPGSYQFAVAVQEPAQRDMFPSVKPRAEEVATRFLKILRASVEDPDKTLPQIVPDKNYRGTFLKLVRNLAPTGKSFQIMEIGAPADTKPIKLIPSARKEIGEALKRQLPQKQEQPEFHEETLMGVLRAIHLDKDWLEVTVGNEHIRVDEVSEAVDDVIGPMVNRPVIVKTVKNPKGHYLFRDIEPAE